MAYWFITDYANYLLLRSPDSVGLKGVPRGFTTRSEVSGVTSVQVLVFRLVCLKNTFFLLYSKVSRV